MTEALLIRVATAAELLGVSTATAYRWIRAGELPAITINGRLRVPRARLEAMLEGQFLPAREEINQ